MDLQFGVKWPLKGQVYSPSANVLGFYFIW